MVAPVLYLKAAVFTLQIIRNPPDHQAAATPVVEIQEAAAPVLREAPVAPAAAVPEAARQASLPP